MLQPTTGTANMESFLKIFLLIFLFSSPEAMPVGDLDTMVKEEMVQIILSDAKDKTGEYEIKLKTCAATLKSKCSNCDVAKRSEERMLDLDDLIGNALMILLSPLNSLKMLLNLVVNSVATILNLLTDAVEAILAELVDALEDILERLVDALEVIVDIVVDAVVAIVAEVTTLLRNLLGVLSMVLENIVEQVGDVVKGLLNQLSNLGNSLLSLVNNLVGTLQNILNGLLGGLLGGLGLGKRAFLHRGALSRRELYANKEKRNMAALTLNSECGSGTSDLVEIVAKVSDVYFQAYSHIMADKAVIKEFDQNTISYHGGCKKGDISNQWPGQETGNAKAIAEEILNDLMMM